MNLNQRLKLGGSVLAIALCFSASAAASGLVASVSLEKKALGTGDDVVVRVTMFNSGDTAEKILRWHTPFGAIEQSLFEITRDGVNVPYEGKLVKRPAPTAADYLVIEPGKAYTATVELSHLYDMSVTGDYSIRFLSKTAAPVRTDKGEQAADEKTAGLLQSEAVSIWIEGDASPAQKAAEQEAALAGSLTFTQCSSSQQTQIKAAYTAAKNMANGSVSYLTGTPGQRYTKWFGAYNASRFNTVKSHFNAIKDAFANKAVVVDCGCKESYYAYVYPNQPYKIYVCNAFWPAPTTGTDSKGGTLVHEMSHFTVVAGTDDWAYGQSAAASLAISNPSQAIDNADSHEYFGENTPSLP
ncbi:M35 family metallo-endopeptidase [Pseudoduganella violacea]|uniref:Peptidyl-Lys metalloendopeptidase n=1 Tax=Pseudoduganella violacea TaxID=1715466 RepID=A0A7W5FW53_9BURK|nr:M35 family metallo-endopeptidase [Pseudoduganella violacea]MBB3120908.1 peptidyl-Lys metalloendopeptidase [Pseudoduganella violacea]